MWFVPSYLTCFPTLNVCCFSKSLAVSLEKAMPSIWIFFSRVILINHPLNVLPSYCVWCFFLLLFVFFKCVMELGCVHSSAKALICLSCLQEVVSSPSLELQMMRHTFWCWGPTHSRLSQCEEGIYTSGACYRALQGGEVARFLSCPIVHQSSCSSWPLHMSYSVHKHDLFYTNYMPGPVAAGTPVPTIAAAWIVSFLEVLD